MSPNTWLFDLEKPLLYTHTWDLLNDTGKRRILICFGATQSLPRIPNGSGRVICLSARIMCYSAASCLGTFTQCPIHLGMRHLFCTGINPKLTLRLALYLGKSHSKIDYTCRKGKRLRSSTYRLLHHTVSSWSSRRYLQIYIGWVWEMTFCGSLMSHEFCLAARPWVFYSPEVLWLSGAGCF